MMLWIAVGVTAVAAVLIGLAYRNRMMSRN